MFEEKIMYYGWVPDTLCTLEDLIDCGFQAEQLAAENGGELPHAAKLRRMGVLYKAIYNRPEDFAHIKMKKYTHRSLQEKVARAEKLAEENGGYLPASSDLRILDGGLRQTMQKHRELFAHIKQKQKDGPARGIDGKFIKGGTC